MECFCTVNQPFISRLVYLRPDSCWSASRSAAAVEGSRAGCETSPAPAARRWRRRVQTVLSMTHALVWCVPADKHNGLRTQWRCLSGSPAGMQNMLRHFPTLCIVLVCEPARCAVPTPPTCIMHTNIITSSMIDL